MVQLWPPGRPFPSCPSNAWEQYVPHIFRCWDKVAGICLHAAIIPPCFYQVTMQYTISILRVHRPQDMATKSMVQTFPSRGVTLNNHGHE